MPEPLPPASDFLAQILRNPANAAILDRWDALRLPDGWLVADLGITTEARNQALVHHARHPHAMR